MAPRANAITITGHVRDGAGMVLRDALIESWQADAAGLYPAPNERRAARPTPTSPAGPGSSPISTSGDWTPRTVKPGRVPHPSGGLMAPHIALWIVARGINTGLQTRIYFEDEDDGQRRMPGPRPDRAQGPHPDPAGEARPAPGAYRFDIVLQGADETVFFDL